MNKLSMVFSMTESVRTIFSIFEIIRKKCGNKKKLILKTKDK